MMLKIWFGKADAMSPPGNQDILETIRYANHETSLWKILVATTDLFPEHFRSVKERKERMDISSLAQIFHQRHETNLNDIRGTVFQDLRH